DSPFSVRRETDLLDALDDVFTDRALDHAHVNLAHFGVSSARRRGSGRGAGRLFSRPGSLDYARSRNFRAHAGAAGTRMSTRGGYVKNSGRSSKGFTRRRFL